MMKALALRAQCSSITGTPLLRKAKQLTRRRLRTYIHTYKFHDGVADGGSMRWTVNTKHRDRAATAHITACHRSVVRAKETKVVNNFQKAVLRKRLGDKWNS